jgi:hypothetical protein
MKKVFFVLLIVLFCPIPSLSLAEELPKIAGRDLAETKPTDAQVLPPILAPTSKVREIGRDGRFIAYDNGTVLDTGTNLMWSAKDNGADVNWKKAKSYCEKYLGGGYTDWRMPRPDELAGLYESSKGYQVIERMYTVHLTELIQLSSNASWTSETRFSIFGSEATAFHFGSGHRFWVPQSYADSYRVLLVRSDK